MLKFSAYLLKLDKSTVLKSDGGLTLNHRITAFNDTRSFENIVGKGENAGIQHFLLFP